MSIYTKSERTVKKYTVAQAVESASRRLGGASVCVDKCRGMNMSDKITLEELNKLAEEIVCDSYYWNHGP